MLYVKVTGKIGEIMVPITRKNVFTLCSRYGKECGADLAELTKGEDFNIESPRVLCPKCSGDKEGYTEQELKELFKGTVRNQRKLGKDRK